MKEYKKRIQIRSDKDFIADTVGHLVSVPDKFAKGDFKTWFKRIPLEMMEYVHKYFGNEEWKDTLQINFNHSPMWDQMKRLFQKGRRTNLFVRSTLGIVTTAATSLWSKLTRRDVYNPFSHSVQVFHPDKAYISKQMAMALNADRSNFPTIRAIGSLGGATHAAGLNILNPFTAMPESWKASKVALEHMPVEERKRVNKLLEPDFVFDTFGGKWIVLPALFLAVMLYKKFRSGERSIFFGNKKLSDIPPPKADALPAPVTQGAEVEEAYRVRSYDKNDSFVKALDLFADHFKPKKDLIYYPGSHVHVAPSFTKAFKDSQILYVDEDRKVVDSLQQSGYKALHEDASFYNPGMADVLILSNFYRQGPLRYVAPGGYVLLTSWGNNELAITDPQFELVGTMDGTGNDMHVNTQDLGNRQTAGFKIYRRKS